MSEYQYYEFQAVDRPLTAEEMGEVRAYSTRAEITPTRFVNEYNWGDFKGRPAEWMERWYDAFLYLANWGSRELMLRVPADALDAATVQQYHGGDRASARVHGDVVILSFSSEDEDHDSWEEDGSGWLASILPLRAELACGDLRALYLGWLLAAQEGELEDDEPEPPVPPGLGTLSGALKAFADFLRLDPDLVRVAAQRSPPMAAGPDEGALPGWIAALPEAEKTELLVRVAGAAPVAVRSEILRRFRMAHRTDTAPAEGVRTGGSCWRRRSGSRRNAAGWRPSERRAKRSGANGRPRRPGRGTWTGWRRARKRRGERWMRWSLRNSRNPTTRPCRCCGTCATLPRATAASLPSPHASTPFARRTRKSRASWTGCGRPSGRAAPPTSGSIAIRRMPDAHSVFKNPALRIQADPPALSFRGPATP